MKRSHCLTARPLLIAFLVGVYAVACTSDDPSGPDHGVAGRGGQAGADSSGGDSGSGHIDAAGSSDGGSSDGGSSDGGSSDGGSSDGGSSDGGAAGADGGSGGETPLSPQQHIQALEDSGKIPKLERTAEIAGIDQNGDGIRDDIAAFIAQNDEDDGQRGARRQFAKVLRDAMLVDKADLVATKAIAVRGSRAVNCIYAHFDGVHGKQPSLVVAELRAISTNTKLRLQAYLAYAKALNGTAGTLPSGDTCE